MLDPSQRLRAAMIDPGASQNRTKFTSITVGWMPRRANSASSVGRTRAQGSHIAASAAGTTTSTRPSLPTASTSSRGNSSVIFAAPCTQSKFRPEMKSNSYAPARQPSRPNANTIGNHATRGSPAAPAGRLAVPALSAPDRSMLLLSSTLETDGPEGVVTGTWIGSAANKRNGMPKVPAIAPTSAIPSMLRGIIRYVLKQPMQVNLGTAHIHGRPQGAE